MLLPDKERALTQKQISELDHSISQLEAVELKMAEDLADIRSKISKIRDQRAALKSRIAAVWALPNELLSYIFELGVMAEREEMEQLNVNEDEDDESTDESGFKVGFQVLVSQVCRMFRDVAIRTSSLWTQICVVDLMPGRLDYVSTCVERSGTLRLDILLENERQSSIGEASSSSTFMAILAPHIPRFKRFTVRLAGFRGLHLIMKTLDRPAPQLETLELSDIDYDVAFDETGAFEPSGFREPLTLFQGNVPKLRWLKLDGVHVNWHTCHFNNLEELHLGYHQREVRPSYDEFEEIVQASPALHVLKLVGSAPLVSDDPMESALHMPIVMEQLTDMTISDIPSDYVTTLVSLFHAPNLNHLGLTDMDANDYSGLLRKIAGPPALYPALTTLKLASLEVDDAACEDLLRAYPKLTYLSLYFSRMSMTFLDMLEPRGDDREVMCPKLQCLRCVGASAQDVQRILESRRDAGFQIPQLEIDKASVGLATTACMTWIRDNTQVDIIVPSNHGSEDEDTDGTGSEWMSDDDIGGFGLPYITLGDFSDFDGMDEGDDGEEEEEEEDQEEEDDDNDSDIEVDGTDDTGGTGDTGSLD